MSRPGSKREQSNERDDKEGPYREGDFVQKALEGEIEGFTCHIYGNSQSGGVAR